MGRCVAYVGKQFSVQYARCANGESPGFTFFESLSKSDQAKVTVLLVYLGDGHTVNKQKFGNLNNKLFELKSFQIRMPYAYSTVPGENGIILITHGFIKKQDKTPKAEIERARRIIEEDRAQVERVRKAGQ